MRLATFTQTIYICFGLLVKVCSSLAALKFLIKGIEEMPQVQRYSVQFGHHAMFASRKGDRDRKGEDVYRVTSASTRHWIRDEKDCGLPIVTAYSARDSL
ncbi:hypothetical protein BST61_g3328 [Cercospora zeina]